MVFYSKLELDAAADAGLRITFVTLFTQQFLWYFMSMECASLAATAVLNLTESLSLPDKHTAVQSDSPAEKVLTLCRVCR